MFISRSIKIFAFLVLCTCIRGTFFDPNGREQQIAMTPFTSSNKQAQRFLQATSNNDKLIQSDLNQIVVNANQLRSASGAQNLTVRPSLHQIVGQWYRALMNSMSLPQYLQLYGLLWTHTYIFSGLPQQFVIGVVQQVADKLSASEYNYFGSYYYSIDTINYDIIIVLIGGLDSFQDILNKEQIFAIIAVLKSNQIKNSSKANNTLVQDANKTSSNNASLNKTTQLVNQTTTNVPSIKSNTESTANSSTNTNNTDKQASPNTTSTPTPTPAPTPTPTPDTTTNNQSIVNSTNAQPLTNTNTNVQTSPPDNINTQVIVNQSTNTGYANVPPTPTPNNQPIVNSSASTDSENAQTTPPQTNSQPANIQISPPTNVNPVNLTKTSVNSTSSATSLPLVTQTIFSNTTNFRNIILTHSIPTTFQKNQYFPFKGYITVNNSNGVQVNVIFTRVNDQRRLQFSYSIPASQSNFQVLAFLNTTGVYYLSIFTGLSGVTSLQQFTISPSFLGSIISRSPTPLSNVSLNLINNNLWLNWTYSDISQPALTQLIFSQDSGQSLQFLISNYQASFQIPYSQFSNFNPGLTSIQISQAFSTSEGANNRSSSFSAPYNIVFNATNHNFAKITTKSGFDTIPLRYASNTSVSINGPATISLDNQIILQTPNNQFQSYYITNQSIATVPSGTIVSITIPLPMDGVYILQINDNTGNAVVNIPLYVGDIYPLIPDFIDLAPITQDFNALSQPTIYSQRSARILGMINKVRSSYGGSQLYGDSNLDILAQNYSNIMIQQGFIGHIDKQGRTPNQRALVFGISEGVGQNLAMNVNLTQAQLTLQRSPSHLRNMVNPSWTRVGLGIAQDSNQYYYLTQQFSSRDMTQYPLTVIQLAQIKSIIVSYILNKYPSIRQQNVGLSEQLKSYQSLSNKPYVLTYLQGYGYSNFGLANVNVSYNKGSFMNTISSANDLKPTSPSYSQVGVSVVYLQGNLQILAAFL